MKSLVVGAMLLRTLNAQIPAPGNVAPALGAPAALPAVGKPAAPLLTPGVDAPSEADLLGSAATGLPAPAVDPIFSLPRGTADVVLPQATAAGVPLGAGILPGTAASGTPIVPVNPFGAIASAVPSVPILSAINQIEPVQPLLSQVSSGLSGTALPNLAPAVPVSLIPLRPVLGGITSSAARPSPTPRVGGFGAFAVPGEVLDPVLPATDVIDTELPVFDTIDTALPVLNAVNTALPVPDAIDTGSPVPDAIDTALPVPDVIDTGFPGTDTIDTAIGLPTTGSATAEENPTVIALPTLATTGSATDSVIDLTTGVPTTTSTTTETATETSTLDNTITNVIDTLLPPVEGAPTGIALPIGSNPYVGPYDPNSIYDPNSPYYDPYAQPAYWEGTDAGDYDGEDDYYYYHQGKPVKRPGYGDNDYPEEECPSWCLEDDSYNTYNPYPTSDSKYSPYKPEPTPKYPSYSSAAGPYPEYKETPEYDPYPQATTYKEEPYPSATPEYYPDPEPAYPQLKKVRSILRAVRRQVYNWGQPPYSDDDEGQYDGEDGSIPDWLYDLDNAPKRPTPTPKPKPTCPKSCYKPKTDDYGYGTKPARPTITKTRKGGYPTSADPYYTSEEPYYTSEDPYKTSADPYQTTRAPYGQGNSTTFYGPTSIPDEPTSVPDEPTSVPDEPTSVPDEPTSIPDEPTSVPTEPTTAYYEPTTLMTQYQPQPYPEQTGYGSSDPGSPAGDYTGDTLDTLCPNTCNPFNPAENFCDITTGCATTGGSKYYCACRAGFRADGYNAKDFSKQFKVAGQPYVYLAVHTSCNTPCSDQTCSEVLERSQCK